MVTLEYPEELAKAMVIKGLGSHTPCQFAAYLGHVQIARTMTEFLRARRIPLQPTIMANILVSEINTDNQYFEMVELFVANGATNWRPPESVLIRLCKNKAEYHTRTMHLFQEAVDRGLRPIADALVDKWTAAIDSTDMFGNHIQLTGVSTLISEYAMPSYSDWVSTGRN
jgi:hypothetical protein